ncbi:MAG: TIGR03915 family putative DNA repair protein, partial [Muribaculaceae bacterium]|nr:TIGR03915 family putative DNA repair protein [Muribaculaceae bacterium]
PTLRFIIKVIASSTPGQEFDFSDPDMLAMLRTARKVNYEAHRMLQFVRFQKAADGTYFAMIDPVHNVLPMTLRHFTDRFADQHFIVYDHRRGYGYLYDGTEPRMMSLPPDLNHIATGMLPDEMLDPEERLFRRLWATYFHAIAIPERKNPRKQRQDMPVRYWRYLTEKLVNGE